MKQKRAYRYRIYPTDEQQHLLARIFRYVRFMHHWALLQITDAYLNEQKQLSHKDLSEMLRALKMHEEYTPFSGISSVQLQQSLRSLELAHSQRRYTIQCNGLKNWETARRKAARLHILIAEQDCNFLHQLSTPMVHENQTTGVESLAVKTWLRTGGFPTRSAIADGRSLSRNWNTKRTGMVEPWSRLIGGTHSGNAVSSVDIFTTAYCLGSVNRCVPYGASTRTGTSMRKKNVLAAGLAVSACGEAVRLGAVQTNPGQTRRSRKAYSREWESSGFGHEEDVQIYCTWRKTSVLPTGVGKQPKALR